MEHTHTQHASQVFGVACVCASHKKTSEIMHEQKSADSSSLRALQGENSSKMLISNRNTISRQEFKTRLS